MAPDFPHPVPCTDSWAALLWVYSSPLSYPVDVQRISVGGPSAGANLAAVVSVLARDAKPSLPPLVLQVLVVPSVDTRYVPIEGPASAECPYDTYRSLEFAPCLPLNRMRWFCNLWLDTDPGMFLARLKKSTDGE